MIQIGVLGSSGKMGQQLESILLSKGLKKTYSPHRGDLLKDNPIFKSSTLLPEIIIDFSSPDFCLQNIELFSEKNIHLKWIIGSTGWSEVQLNKLESYTNNQEFLRSANFSIGVHLLKKALKSIAQQFLEDDFNVHLSEVHHIHKKDSPSGTALQLKEVLTPFLGLKSIDIESKREGNEVGFHEVTFESQHETVKLSHRAKNRSVFAEGAVYCAQEFLRFQSNESKIFNLDDLFSLKKSVL